MGKMRPNFRAEKGNIARERPILERHSDESQDRTRNLPADKNQTPSSEAIVVEQIDNFYEIMGKLPTDYAEVIRLRSIARMSFKEVAENMGRTHDSVTKLWYRAILKFEEI